LVRPSVHSTAAALAAAKLSLEDKISSDLVAAFQAGSTGTAFSCPAAVSGGAVVSGAYVLSTMPAWFVADQVRAQAAYVGLRSLLRHPIPESGAGLEAWYHLHTGAFASVCVSAVFVQTLAQAQSVATRIKAGMTVAQAARRYSIDPTSKAKGGSIGCFSPNSASWQNVQAAVGRIPTGQVAIYSGQSQSGAPYYYLLVPTKRTANAFHAVAAAVAAEAVAANRQAVAFLAAVIVASKGVTVSPEIGTWVPSAVGGSIAPSPTPPADAIVNPVAIAPPPAR